MKEGGEKERGKKEVRRKETCFECTFLLMQHVNCSSDSSTSPSAQPFRDLSQSPSYLWCTEKQ